MTDWPLGVGRCILETIDSTNAYARRSIAKIQYPIWIMAYEQTLGVGRRGRAWSSRKGNFSASYIGSDEADLKTIALRSFVASLALYDAFIKLGIPSKNLSLKWPNDVLYDGGKLAGILLETIGKTPQCFCIGIGVNLSSSPKITELESGAITPKSLCNDAGVKIMADAFLDILAVTYDRREKQFMSEGFTPIRLAWLKQAAKLGEIIVARMPNEEIHGIFETVDETGGVVLQTSKGRRTIHAAEIFFT